MKKELAAELAGKILAGIALLQEDAEALQLANAEYTRRVTGMMAEAAENIRLVGGVDLERLDRAVEEFMPEVAERHFFKSLFDHIDEGCHDFA